MCDFYWDGMTRSVSPSPPPPSPPPCIADSNFSCADGDARLVGGLSSADGRVELCHDNHFGTVCEENWTNKEAEIVCSQLGFTNQGERSFSSKHTCT